MTFLYKVTWMNHANIISEKLLDSKDCILYDSIYVMFWKRQTVGREQITGCLGVRGAWSKFGRGWCEVVLQFDGDYCDMLCTFVKTHRTLHLSPQ